MSDELQADLARVHGILWEFAGATAAQKAAHAVERIEYLKLALKVSEHNERAAMDVLEQDRLELFECRQHLKRCKESRHGSPGTQSG